MHHCQMNSQIGEIKMTYIFVGFVLILIDLTISVGKGVLDILPDFVGYILILKAMQGLAKRNPHFERGEKITRHIFWYTFVLFVADITGIFLKEGIVYSIVGAALEAFAILASLALSYYIVTGVMRIEKAEKCDLKGKYLLLCWRIMAAFHVIAFAASFVKSLRFIMNIGSLMLSLLFLMALYDTDRANDKCAKKSK